MATQEELRTLALNIATNAVRDIEFMTVDDYAFAQRIDLSEDEMKQVHDLVTSATVTLKTE